MRVAERVYGGCRRCPPSIHQVLERVEERDRMLAAISWEVAEWRSIIAKLVPMYRNGANADRPARRPNVA